MSHADANHDGVLDEAEFSRHVAPLLYEEMRLQGVDDDQIPDWLGGKAPPEAWPYGRHVQPVAVHD